MARCELRHTLPFLHKALSQLVERHGGIGNLRRVPKQTVQMLKMVSAEFSEILERRRLALAAAPGRKHARRPQPISAQSALEELAFSITPPLLAAADAAVNQALMDQLSSAGEDESDDDQII